MPVFHAFSLWLKEDGDIRVQEAARRDPEDIGECTADVTKSEIRCAIDNLCAGDIAVGTLLSRDRNGDTVAAAEVAEGEVLALNIPDAELAESRHRSAECQGRSLRCRCLG